MKLSEFRRREEVGQAGVWVDLGEGLRVKVARMSRTNVNYRNALQQLGRPHRSLVRRTGEMPEDVAEQITLEAAAKHILLGWEGLVEDDGTEIEYSPEKALEVLTEFPEFTDLVFEAAQDLATFAERELEDAAGN